MGVRAETRVGKTKWGDREGRRRDILDAARAQMHGGGYLALNMRDIAAGAGVSPGTLYSYFATKEEIFAALYAEAIESHNERIAPVCADAETLEDLLVALLCAHLDLYGSYGRYFTLWSALRGDPDSDLDGGADGGAAEPADGEAPGSGAGADTWRALRRATLRQGELVDAAIRRVTAAHGQRLVDESLALPLLWTVFNGVADHFTSDRRHLTPHGPDQLIAFAAATLARGIVVADDPAA